MRNFLILVSFLVSAQTMAWSIQGHRVVGEMAERHLSIAAKKELLSLLDGQSLAKVANFPDDMKNHPDKAKWEPTFIWHYVYIPAGFKSYDEAPKNAAGDAVVAVEKLIGILIDKKQSKESRAEAVKFLVHIIGDIHQPLHAGYAEDRGGNTCKVKWFGVTENLHNVWDEKMVDHQKLSYTEWVNWLSQTLSPAKIKEWSQGDMRAWIAEDLAIRDSIYPAAPKGEAKSYCRWSLKDSKNVASDEEMPQLSWQYIYENRNLLEQRLTQAGLRLAMVLNNALTGKVSTKK